MKTKDPKDERPVLKMAQDEACFGRISTVRRSWAPKPVRPLVPNQIVHEYTYAYAAVAPKEGKMTSLILPYTNTTMMNIFLEHVSRTDLANTFWLSRWIKLDGIMPKISSCQRIFV